MASKKFFVTGDKEIDRKLKALEPKIAKKVVRQATRNAMKVVKSSVEQNAPVGATGLLSRSVKLKSKRSRRGLLLDAQIGQGDFKGDSYYAAMVEYGTSKMAPRGYMRKAFDEKGDEAKEIAMREIRAGIEREI